MDSRVCKSADQNLYSCIDLICVVMDSFSVAIFQGSSNFSVSGTIIPKPFNRAVIGQVLL